MAELIKRTISGAIFIALVIASILINKYTFFVVFLAICVLAIIEFQKLANTQPAVKTSAWTTSIAASVLFISSFLYASGIASVFVFAIYGMFFIAIVIAELFRTNTNAMNNLAYFVLGQAYIAVPFSALNFILFSVGGYQPLLLLSVFVIIWINDTAAYLFGISFGKHRLFERISPKKSWEGFIGGAIISLLTGYVFSLFIFIPEITLSKWLILSQIIIVFGTLGDLLESLIKRTAKVKDSGDILPGHGGVLDRFDSMLLVSPVVLIYFGLLFSLV